MTDQILENLTTDGYTLIEDVIPADKVDDVRNSLAACLQSESEAVQKRDKEIRSKGHRLGGAGVQALPGIINRDQSFVPYLADERLLETITALFGPYHRITNTSAIANHPGNDRGYWHADWPYNQTNAAHIPVPYADAVLKLSSLWVLTEFTPETGGTYVLPRSHKDPSNPSGGGHFDRESAHPDEVQIAASAGSVILFDSRLWHCVATNHTDLPRYAMNIGYAPWWLNLEPQRVGSPDHTAMVVEPDGKPNVTPMIPKEVFESFPDIIKPLFRHWIE
jgi:ectoine hydroxylase-related dioxygenase (phytanoyl-CoA dioxygenase family)